MTAAARITTISGSRLINMSLGYNWYQAGIDANNSLAAQIITSNQGLIFATMLSDLEAMGVGIPLLVVAAGNESNSFGATVDARWASPMANAALEHDAVDVLVVEAVGVPAAAGAPAWCASFSNPGGRISAPGVAIASLSHPAPYELMNGTSMAAPHVTGAAGFLLALAPELTNGQLRGALLRSTQPTTGGAATCLDLFASALNIDWVRGDARILHRLLDIDDGSADGNLRLDAAGQAVGDEDLDGDGGPGDGRIDMRDFRRWRDWLLQIEGDAALVLDGAPDHPKRDVNGNGTVESAAQENRYPRGDFNGDGRLDRNATRLVDGAVDAVLSDLGVLQHAFVDPHVAAAELLGLGTRVTWPSTRPAA